MATSKATPTTRRGGSSKGSAGSTAAEERISPARWGGVVLVIAALVGAIVLAAISPSEPDEPGQAAVVPAVPTPTPAPPSDGAGIPTLIPTIESPEGGPEGDPAVDLLVKVPEVPIKRKDLTLVVYRGDTEVRRLEGPRKGRSVEIKEVRLQPGSENVISVALEGPGGVGPRSEPVIVIQDPDAPSLQITQPEDGARVWDKTIEVAGTSEVGSEVTVTNLTNGSRKPPREIGASGDFSTRIRLQLGDNRIEVKSVDSAGLMKLEEVDVFLRDGTPYIKFKNVPKKLSRAELPRPITIAVIVTDDKERPMEGATVEFSLGAAIPAQATKRTTDADGRASWKPNIPVPIQGADKLALSVAVTSPWEWKDSKRRTITLVP